MKIVLAYPASDERVDGIRDYSNRVAETLRSAGRDAVLVHPSRDRRLPANLLRTLPRDDGVQLLVQYNPFSWGRWGVAPHLAVALALVRLRRPNVRIVLVIHEAYMPMLNLRWMLMGSWQRAQMRVLLKLAHCAVATAGYLCRELSRGWPRRPIHLVPVGSNLPDERGSRADARAAGGYDGRLVIATFSTGHVSHLSEHVALAAEAVARASRQPVILLLLGSNNPAPPRLAAVERTVVPGYQDARDLACALSSADLFLAPFADGATVHRTTLMAAMQHGVAIVTTASARTESLLLEDGALAFAPADSGQAFAEEAVRVGVNHQVREHHGRAARALYERWFSWPAVCAGLRVGIGESPRRA